MPKLAVFPKAFMKALCVTGEMTLDEWIDLASGLEIDGLEWYASFLEMADPKNWARYRNRVHDTGLEIPMMCCSPDFTHPDPAFRNGQIGQQKKWIDMTAALGGRYCRVLSGQRRPELSVDEGVKLAVEAIHECLDYARTLDITLILENHYKDDFWKFPEFAQKAEVFCQLVEAIEDPHFGVNYDPSNAFLAGEDPLELLEKVKYRVKTMHASDRYLVGGTLEDLRKMEDNSEGYAAVLRHGEIGKGLNDYDAIFTTLRAVGFDGWISIEDGVDGMDQLARSVSFVNRKVKQYW
ncbi:sugar phosphate isomerase/epimerase family protein [Parapedobacter soli]|uniref:sugar phosphate isomerase/epimerase family protein n=1 Tax=Parapedobacter soli TaxID=416955 RepID=UPI0021C8F9AA|nr:sugar phosphate isomerase/epimerase family protein [Parapedobacter soli]